MADDRDSDSPIEELAGFELRLDADFTRRVGNAIEERETVGSLVTLGSMGLLTVLLELIGFVFGFLTPGRSPTEED